MPALSGQQQHGPPLRVSHLEQPVVQVLHKALQKTLGDTQLRAALFAMGQEVSPLQSLAEADAAYKAEIANYQGIARAIGLQNP